MIKVSTSSGAEYLFDTEAKRFRRVNPSHVKRGDEEWLSYFYVSSIEVGHAVIIVLESLAKYGPDDTGVQNLETGDTTRITTPITSIEEIAA